MSGVRIARLAVSVVLLFCIITPVLWFSDPKAMTSALSELSLLAVVLVVLLLLAGVILSSLRLQLITADLGYRLSFRDAAMTLSIGQLTGTAFFQIAGQLIGRSAVLSRRGIPAAATVVISGYERVVALSVSLLLAGCGSFYLFGTLNLNTKTGGLLLIKLALDLAVVLIAGGLFVWGQAVVPLARSVTWEQFLSLLRSFVISLAIQGTTLAAYVALEKTLAPGIAIASLVATSSIIMLAASLPISFGGWGLRELSAVVALQTIGLSSATALLIALLIGILSLAVIAGMAVAVTLVWEPRADIRATIANPEVRDYARAIDWVLPSIAAMAVYFQIYIPTGSGPISVNLADPVVILGASLFALHHVNKGWPFWRIPHLGIWVGAASAVILLSILRGWAAFGWTDWAFFNRGLGWLVLLCYGATGALIVRRAQYGGFEFLLRTFAVSGVAIALVEVGLIILKSVGFAAAGSLVEPRISGLSQNANAFAFLLMLALAVVIVIQSRPAAQIGMMTAILLGIWFSGSRAALGALPVVLVVAVVMGAAVRPILLAILSTAVVVAVMAVASVVTIGASVNVMLLHGRIAESIVPALGRSDTVGIQHLETILDGLSLFWTHPIIGSGLGAYMDQQMHVTGVPLLIHSTPVWLLAETGLLGFSVFLAAGCYLLSNAIRHRGDPAAFLLVLLLCALGVMSAVHELLYQRAFWLLIGAALAVPATVAVKAALAPDGR